MTKQTLIIIAVFLVFVSATVGAYFVFVNTRENNDSQTSKYSPANTAEDKFAITKNTQSQSDGKLQVQGANTNQSNNQNSLPEPKNFSVYEKYANDETASYIDIEVGKGSTVEGGDTVAIVYKGWLTSGELFDQSQKNEQGQLEPFVLEIGAGQVIPGWEQTILGMKQGGKRRLIIPPVAGYGSSGQGPIPPNAMLIFDVELVELQKKDLNPPGTILP